MTYDCIFSVGQWCATATYLTKYSLRGCSGPFDWFLAHHVPFATYVDVICRDFDGFMTADTICPDPDTPGRYVETTSKMVSMHDFRAGVPFAEELPVVEAKFLRRAARFRVMLARSQRVLFVRCVQAQEADIDDLCLGLSRLRAKFPRKTIDLVVLQHDAKAVAITTESPMSGLTVHRAPFFGLDGKPVIGNERLCGRVFASLHVRGKWKNRLWRRLKTLRGWYRKHRKCEGR